MGGGILAYEMAAPSGELLSEGVDRALEAHRLVTTAAVGYVSLHLLNVLPDKLDLFHQATKFKT